MASGALGVDQSADQAHELARTWLASFSDAVSSARTNQVEHLFTADASWRDIVALTRGLRSVQGIEALTAMFGLCVAQVDGNTVELSSIWPPRHVRRADRDVVEVFFDFETRIGRGAGVVRLSLDDPSPKAWTLLTTLEELLDRPEAVASRRPHDVDFAAHFGAPNWLDRRNSEVSYRDREPAVLVVGAGQAGLTLAARLRALDIDTLVIESGERVGDNWRNRYHSLWLHNELAMNHLPYMPFPDTWPTYLSKDQMAFWLETYAVAMELNIWTGTRLVGAHREHGADARWDVEVVNGEGFRRHVRPAHVVMATGVSGKPRRADLPGLAQFQGPVLHSSEFVGGHDYRGQKAIVFGVANSGSDVAQDLRAHGCEVTMVQRGPVTVVSQNPGSVALNQVYTAGYPLPVADMMTIATPGPAGFDAHRAMTRKVRELDIELITALNAIGFKTDYGHDETGFGMKYYRTGGGGYLNVGCAQLLISGAITLLQHDTVEEVVPNGVRLSTGETVEASLIVLGTGYSSLSSDLALYFGDEVAARLGPVWGVDDEGELNNMWRPTPESGLWFHAGSLYQCRIFSKYLALQIAATELALFTDDETAVRGE